MPADHAVLLRRGLVLTLKVVAVGGSCAARWQATAVGVYRLGERLFRARVPAGSYLMSKPLAHSTLREIYNLTVVAIERDGQVMPSRRRVLSSSKATSCFSKGSWRTSAARVVWSPPWRSYPHVTGTSGIWSRQRSSWLGGALAMMLAGVLTMDQAYLAIEWGSVFLVAGMLPMGIAMTKTGAAALLANGLITLLGPAGPLALLAGLFVLTTLLTQAMHSAAVAAVVAPIAIRAAQRIGADPRALAMGVALATSMAFLTPLGHPVNMLVMGPGGYRFRDYVKVGLPLTLLLFVVVMLMLPVFWPLTPH